MWDKMLQLLISSQESHTVEPYILQQLISRFISNYIYGAPAEYYYNAKDDMRSSLELFIQANVSHSDWRNRRAGLFALATGDLVISFLEDVS